MQTLGLDISSQIDFIPGFTPDEESTVILFRNENSEVGKRKRVFEMHDTSYMDRSGV